MGSPSVNAPKLGLGYPNNCLKNLKLILSARRVSYFSKTHGNIFCLAESTFRDVTFSWPMRILVIIQRFLAMIKKLKEAFGSDDKLTE